MLTRSNTAKYTRYVQKPFNISTGQTIPAGSVVEVPFIATLRDPNLYTDPEVRHDHKRNRAERPHPLTETPQEFRPLPVPEDSLRREPRPPAVQSQGPTPVRRGDPREPILGVGPPRLSRTILCRARDQVDCRSDTPALRPQTARGHDCRESKGLFYAKGGLCQAPRGCATRHSFMSPNCINTLRSSDRIDRCLRLWVHVIPDLRMSVSSMIGTDHHP